MNTSASRGRETGEVDDEVPYLTEEVVLVGIPIDWRVTSDGPSWLGQNDLPPPAAYGSESMTAIPAKFDAAFNVGTLMASPTNCV